jgi:hypothetical protein
VVAVIRVFQCKDDCCLVQVPSRRFWLVSAGTVGLHTAPSFKDAFKIVDSYLTEEATA